MPTEYNRVLEISLLGFLVVAFGAPQLIRLINWFLNRSEKVEVRADQREMELAARLRVVEDARVADLKESKRELLEAYKAASAGYTKMSTTMDSVLNMQERLVGQLSSRPCLHERDKDDGR